MATFTVDIPDDQVERIFNAFCGKYFLQRNANLDITPDLFSRQMVIQYINNVVEDYERQQAISNVSTPPPPSIT